MRNLHFKTTAYKFTTVPQTAACFAGHYIYRTGDEADHPARNIVDALKAHVEIFEMVLVFKGSKPNVNN